MEWYSLNKPRFEIEKKLLREHHSQVELHVPKKAGGCVTLHKKVRTSRDVYHLEGKFAHNHPYSPMTFKITQPKLKYNTPHCFSSGVLCLHRDNEVGPQTTAKVYLDWAIQWIQTYEQWLETGHWPKTNRG